MNKTEAAKYLGIGVRSLERHTSDGRVRAEPVKGKTGKRLDYDADELARFKEELEAPPPPLPEGPQGSPPNLAAIAATSATALARLSGAPASLHRMSDLTGLAGAQTGEVDKEGAARFAAVLDAVEAHRKPRAELADKLLLTLAECSALTGLSRQNLRGAIGERKLKAKQIGRAWRVKKSDLEAFVEKL
jgi:excisionase family DNA binding protein